MDLDELYEEIKSIKNWIENKCIQLNRSGELDEFLINIGYKENVDDFESYCYVDMSRAKILVLGDSKVKLNDLQGIARKLGIDTNQIDFILDYDKIKNISAETYRCSSTYSDILIGPVGHKAKDIGGSSSLVAEIENNKSEYPNLIKLQDANEFKITKTNFSEALLKTKLYLYNLN